MEKNIQESTDENVSTNQASHKISNLIISLMSKFIVNKQNYVYIKEFKVLNRIIETNIPAIESRLYSFNINDFNNYETLLKNSEFNKDHLNNIDNMKQTNKLLEDGEECREEDKNFLTKFFLFIISYQIHFSPQIKSKNINYIEFLFLILKMIKKFLQEDILGIKEISLISKFLIIHSFFSNILKDPVDRISKNIKNVLPIWLMLSLVGLVFDHSKNLNENDTNSLVSDLIEFINEKLLDNMNNIFILKDSQKFMTLLEILKNQKINSENRQKIIKTVIKVYGNSYDLNFMKSLFKGVKESLVNLTKINEGFIKNNSTYEEKETQDDLKVIRRDIDLVKATLLNDIQNVYGISEFLKICSLKEKENNLLDPFKISNGFLLKSGMNSGITLSPIISFPKKGYSLVFSFKWLPSASATDKRYNLISFVKDVEFKKDENIKDFISLSVFIENQRLFIQIKELWNTEIIIQPNQSYLIAILQVEPGFFSRNKSKISVVVNHGIIKSHDILGYPSGKMKCEVGCLTQFDIKSQKIINNFCFTGLIGTIILFVDVFYMDIINRIFELKGEYEMILFKNYEFHIPMISKSVEEVLYYMKKNDTHNIEANVAMIISSRSVLSSSCVSSTKSNHFKENYSEFMNNKNMVMLNRKFVIDPSIQTFEHKNFNEEFLKFEGLKFLALLILNPCQIPMEEIKNDESICDKISSLVGNIIDHILLLLEVANLDYYSQQFDYFFYYLGIFFQQGSLFNSIMKLISSMDINSEINYFLSLRNNLWDLFLDKKLYDEDDHLSLQSILSIFYSSLKHNPVGLLNSHFLYKILDFSFIYTRKILQSEETADVKRAYSHLLFNFISFCCEKDKILVIKDYLTFLMKDENSENKNLYFLYKMLKFLYFSNSKDAVSTLEKQQTFSENINSLSSFCIELIPKLEQIRNAFVLNPKELSVIELIKALCIRFIDDFYIKYDKENVLNNKDTNGEFQNRIKTRENLKTFKQKRRSSSKTKTIKANKVYKYSLIEKVTDILIPSVHTLNSLILNIYNSSNFHDNLKFIKKSTDEILNFEFFSKDALTILIKIFERVSTNSTKIFNSFQEESSVMKYFYTMASKIFVNLIQKFRNSEIDKETKRLLREIFQSNKISLKFYFCGFNYIFNRNRESVSNLSSSKNFFSCKDDSAINSVSESEGFKMIDISISNTHITDDVIKNSLITIIQSSINSLVDPFYFNLIFALYCNNENSLIVELYIAILSEMIKAKGKELNSKYIVSNLKNMLILTYRILFLKNTSNKRKILFSPKFEEGLLTFLIFLFDHQIIYTKISFSIFQMENKKKYEEGKQRTVLEMIFEILLELNKIYKMEKFLNMFENVFFINDHSIFFYLDLFYYFPDCKQTFIEGKIERRTLKKIQTYATKEGSTNIFMSSYFFLSKILVYLHISERRKEDENKLKRDALLLKLSNLIAEDIQSLVNDFNLFKNKAHSRIEIKDFLYNESKKLFDNSFLKEKDFNLFKQEYNEVIKANKRFIEKYYKLSGFDTTIDAIIENKMDLTLQISIQDSSKMISSMQLNLNDTESVLNPYKTNSSDSIIANNLISDSILCTEHNSNINTNGEDRDKSSEKLQENKIIKSIETKEKKSLIRSVTTNYNSMGLKTETYSVEKKNSHMSLYAKYFHKLKRNSNKEIEKSEDLDLKTSKTFDIKNSFQSIHSPNLLESNKSKLANQISSLENVEESDEKIKYLISAPDEGCVDITTETVATGTFGNIIINKPKKDLLMTTFSIFFVDNFFCDPLFDEIVKKKFNALKLNTGLKSKNETSQGETISSGEANETESKERYPQNDFVVDIKYPVKIKNLFSKNYLRLFIKPDTEFYSRNELLKISHSYLTIDDYQKYNFIKFKNMKYNACLGNTDSVKFISEFNCELITIQGVIFGKLKIFKDYIQFLSKFDEDLYNPKGHLKYNEKLDFLFSSVDSDIIFREKDFKMYFEDISEFLIKRFLFMLQGVEIFMKNGKSYFFNLFKFEHNSNFFKIISDIHLSSNTKYNFLIVNNLRKHFKKLEYSKKWVAGKISNLEYLLLINKYSGRSFHDPNQYPILPWVICKFSQIKLNLSEETIFRNLSYPVSVHLEEKRIAAVKKYEESDYDGKFKHHFGTHYSTSAFVFNYLVRLTPFNYDQIKLQKNKFEHPSRMFHKLSDTWHILENFTDNRELTPELFFQPELCINLNRNFFGYRSDNQLVDNLVLPNWARNPVDFISKHRRCLESKDVSKNLPYWIDNVFGWSQLNKTKESLNVFIKYTYEQENNLQKKLEKYQKNKIKEEEIIKKIRNKVDIIINFGQTPYKLLEEKQTKRIQELKVDNIEEDLKIISDYVRYKKNIELKNIRYFSYSKSFFYFLNDEREIEIYDRVKFSKHTKIRMKHFLYLNTITNTNFPIYRLKYAITELNDCKYFISCRHLDGSFKIYHEDGEIKEILTDSFICSILKNSDENMLYTGHNNGKLLMWIIQFTPSKKNKYNINSIQIMPFKSLISHEGAVTSIYLNEKLNIIATGGEDGYVYIRNLYDLEILSCIRPENGFDQRALNIVDIVISVENLLYVTCFDRKNYILFGYNVNGIKFAHITGMFSHVDLVLDRFIFYSQYDSNLILLVDQIEFDHVVYEWKLDEKGSGYVTSFCIIDDDEYMMYTLSQGLVKKDSLQKIKEIVKSQ